MNLDIIGPKARILVVAAHPDDEALGCGGTLRKAVKQGAQVSVLFLTDGTGARPDSTESAAVARNQNSLEALKCLGIQDVEYLGFPDNQLDQTSLLTLIQGIEKVSNKFKPTVVLTHHGGDLNVDHRIACEATLVASRPLLSSQVKVILSFEVPSSTEWRATGVGSSFEPSLFVDIEHEVQDKMIALACYEAEMRPFPHSRSIEAVESLAKWRGACAGVSAAEAFAVLRMVI